jgi:hypothetical protein
MKCGCVDNTACGGNYWQIEAKLKYYKDKDSNEIHLCSECVKPEFIDGSIDEDAGHWHNLFPKKHWTEYGTKEEILEASEKNYGDFVNAKEYFEKIESDKKESGGDENV